MKVKDCMCHDICYVKPNTNIYEVTKIMSNNHIGCLPVCNENAQIVGLVTDRDIALRCIACDKDVKQTPVSEIMTNNVCCCGIEDDIYEAEKQMAKNQIRRLPVTNNGKVVGILTLGDLAKYNEEIGMENVSTTFEKICSCKGNSKNAE